MADPSSPIPFDDIPLDDARKMGRGPRMDPVLYHALTGKIQSLAHTAARMTIPPGTNPTTMKHRILRAAADLKIPVTIRTVPGGLLFWRSTDDDSQQAKAVAQRRPSAQRGRAGRRRRAPARARQSS